MVKLKEWWSSYKGLATLAFAVVSGVATGSFWISSRLASLDRVEEGLAQNTQALSSIAGDLKELRGEIHSLEVKSSESSIRGSNEREVHEKQEEAIDSLKGEVGTLKERVARMDEALEMLKPLVTEGLAFGRISIEDVRKVYTPEEIGEFLQDAEKLFSPDNGGGGGGSGSDGVRVAHGSITETGDCVGLPKNCVFMSLNMPSSDSDEKTLRQAKVELHYGLNPSQLASLLKGSHEETVGYSLAQLQSYEGPLCEWIAIRLLATEAPNQAA